jgi:GGDEF domain-containing protein
MRRIQKFCKKNPMQAAELSIPVSLSYGVACTEESGIEDSTALLKSADKRLFSAKAKKRGKKR